MIIKSAGVGSGVEALEGTLSDEYQKAPLGQDLISGRILGNVFGVTTAVGTAGISTYAILDKWKSIKGKDGKVYLNNLLVNISTIMWNMFKYYFRYIKFIIIRIFCSTICCPCSNTYIASYTPC